VIDAEEIRARSAEWGTAPNQISKDHLISHVLATLVGFPGLVFFGGTALNRTFLKQKRLSEDIDLYQQPDTLADTAEAVSVVRSGTVREFPDMLIERTDHSGDVKTYEIKADGHRVQLQFVGPRPENARHETEMTAVSLRYSDLPESVLLPVPTLSSFFAMKCAAFESRTMPRDLFDLAALSDIGGVNADAIEALRRFRGSGPTRWMYEPDQAFTEEQWSIELAHQIGNPINPVEALTQVRGALDAAGAWS